MQLIKIIITTVFFLFFYGFLEVFKQKFKVKSEITRKLAHLLSGAFAVLFSFFLNKTEFIFVTSLFFVFFLIAYNKKLLKSINISSRKTYGEIVYPLGLIVLTVGLYHLKKQFIIGVLILAIPDTIAGCVGFKLRKKSKSLAGSLAYFFTTLILLLFNLNLASSILFAFILALIEFISPFGLDNLSIPIAYYLLSFLF